MGRISAVVVAVLAAATPARADEVGGVVVDDANLSLSNVVVRVIGETFVVMAKTDDRGQFHVSGLPSGSYRVVVDRGTVRPPPPPAPPPRPIRIDREYTRCCICAMSRRTFEGALPSTARGFVDTRSTAQGIVIESPGR